MILREPDSRKGFIKDYTCSKITTLGKIGFITFIFSTNGPAAHYHGSLKCHVSRYIKFLLHKYIGNGYINIISIVGLVI